MAKGFLSRGVRIVATRVVLRHSSPKCQVGSCPHLPLRPSTRTDVMDQQGTELGSSQGRANTAEPYPRSLRGRFQSSYCNASYAGSSSPALQTPAPPHVGIQPGRTVHYSEFPWHDAQGDVKSFFGTQIECPDTTEDVGLSSNRTAAPVSNPMAEHTVLLFIMTSF